MLNVNLTQNKELNVLFRNYNLVLINFTIIKSDNRQISIGLEIKLG